MDGIVKRAAIAVVLLALLGVAGCGGDDEAAPPAWAKVAPEQIAEAKKHGVPVAFENDLGMRFVLIPAGTFLMGSPEDKGPGMYQTPQHEVTLTVPFYTEITEVTNGLYRRHRPGHDSGVFDPLEPPDASRYSLNGDEQPAVHVSHHDAKAFALWLSHRDAGWVYRLPTEAEWEYACRACAAGRFPWGESEAEAHHYDNLNEPETRTVFKVRHFYVSTDVFSVDDGHRVSAPTGAYRPNAWGLFDMMGNVGEWCGNWLGPYPVDAATNPTGPGHGEERAIRGSAWGDGPRDTRCGARGAATPDYRGEQVGIRLVSPLPER